MTRLWAMTVDFDTVAVGDTLPVLIKWETEESIRRYAALHGEEAEGAVPEALPTKAVENYVTELLSKGFPLERLDAEGTAIVVEHLLPVRANDTISLSGLVVDRHTTDGLRLVECDVAVENDRGEPVARARAVISL